MTGHDDTVPVRLEPHPADERLAVLRVDRPPVNAFDQRMWDRFDAVTASLHGDTLYRAVVITGGQRHFAAGADVKELLDLAPEQFGARNRVLQRCFHALATAPQITIAAVSGLKWRPTARSCSSTTSTTRLSLDTVPPVLSSDTFAAMGTTTTPLPSRPARRISASVEGSSHFSGPTRL